MNFESKITVTYVIFWYEVKKEHDFESYVGPSCDFFDSKLMGGGDGKILKLMKNVQKSVHSITGTEIWKFTKRNLKTIF